MTTAYLISYTVLWLLVLMQGVLLLLIYRHFGLVALGTFDGVQRDGVAVGSQAPRIADDGSMAAPAAVGTFYVRMFLSPECEPCGNIAPYLDGLASRGIRDHRLVVTGIITGNGDALHRFIERFRPNYSCVGDEFGDITKAYKVRVTPFGFVSDAAGTVLSKGLCNDPKALANLLSAAGIAVNHQDLVATQTVVVTGRVGSSG